MNILNSQIVKKQQVALIQAIEDFQSVYETNLMNSACVIKAALKVDTYAAHIVKTFGTQGLNIVLLSSSQGVDMAMVSLQNSQFILSVNGLD